MPFGPKRTVGILVHCSKAQSGSMQKPVEACRSQWEAVEDSGRQWEGQKLCGSEWKTRKGRKGSERGQEGPEGVRKAMGEGRRGGKGLGK